MFRRTIDRFPVFALLGSVIGMGAASPLHLHAQQSCLCDPENARSVALIYNTLNPIAYADEATFDETRLLLQHDPGLRPDAATIQCARDLGNAFVEGGLAVVPSQADLDRAEQRIYEMGGTLERASEVRSEMQSRAGSYLVVGRELQWLAQVVPAAANGDWSAYDTQPTRYREQARELAVLVSPDIASAIAAFTGRFMQGQFMLASCLLGS